MLARPLLPLLLISATAPIPTIGTFGTVKSLVETRADSPKTTLASVLARPHAYAVGSLSHLRGEITILDGVAWLAYPPPTSGGTPRVTAQGNGAEQAAFLATAYVDPSAWQKVAVAGELTSDGLDDALAKLAADHGLRGRDFPFRVDGHLASVTLAIVDGRRVPPGPGSEATMKKANVLEMERDVDGALVGFYSVAGNEIFTHEGAHSHVHAVIAQRRATGHAQSFEVSRGAVISLPAAPPP